MSENKAKFIQECNDGDFENAMYRYWDDDYVNDDTMLADNWLVNLAARGQHPDALERLIKLPRDPDEDCLPRVLVSALTRIDPYQGEIYDESSSSYDQRYVHCNECDAWESSGIDDPLKNFYMFTHDYDNDQWQCNSCHTLNVTDHSDLKKDDLWDEDRRYEMISAIYDLRAGWDTPAIIAELVEDIENVYDVVEPELLTFFLKKIEPTATQLEPLIESLEGQVELLECVYAVHRGKHTKWAEKK